MKINNIPAATPVQSEQLFAHVTCEEIHYVVMAANTLCVDAQTLCSSRHPPTLCCGKCHMNVTVVGC